MQLIRPLAIVAGAAAIVLIAIASAGPLMSQVEQPTYEVLGSTGPIEVRAYPSMIVAEAAVAGERKAAIGEGFRLIAGYIFGGNAASQKVAMTAPVLQERVAEVHFKGKDAQQPKDGVWVVRFVMPRKWTLATLPGPRDPRIKLVTRAAATFAAIRFSGLAGDAAIAKRTGELEAYVARNKFETVGAPILAFFNPPWTLPFLRRNEVMIEVKLSS